MDFTHCSCVSIDKSEQLPVDTAVASRKATWTISQMLLNLCKTELHLYTKKNDFEDSLYF